MKVLESSIMQAYMRMANDGWLQGWHERNGGNLTYRMKPEEVEAVREDLHFDSEWKDIGATVPGLAGEFFIATGSGKYFRNVLSDPEDSCAICEIDESGEHYRVVWGLVNGGRPTSELPTHLMAHEVKKVVTNGAQRVVYHAHPANIIALTAVMPLSDEVFTRELWETMTECPVVYPQGCGVVEWMVPGGREIAEASVEKLKNCDVIIWAHHGMFCTGETFDLTFGLMHTVEKSAEILVKIRSMAPRSNFITPDQFRDLAKSFGVELPEKFLYER